MPYHDEFTDHDLLPAPTSHAAIVAQVARLRSQLAEANAKLTSEIIEHRHFLVQDFHQCEEERDAARQALRDLVDAAIDHRVGGYRLVSEEEMQRAAALVTEWFQGEKPQ